MFCILLKKMGYCNFVWKQTWIISIIPVCVHYLYRGKSPNPTTPQGKVAAPPGQQQPSPASPRLVPSGPLPASSLPQPLTPQSTPSAQSMPGSKVQYYTALGLNMFVTVLVLFDRCLKFLIPLFTAFSNCFLYADIRHQKDALWQSEREGEAERWWTEDGGSRW